MWRHGEAELSRPDEQRALTNRGEAQCHFMATGYEQWRLSRDLAPVATVLFSPYRRTRETAEVLSTVFESATVQEAGELAPGARLERFASMPFAEDDHVVMVSHQPFVSHAVAHWTDDATLAPIAPGGYSVLEVLDLQRGGVTCLRHCPDPSASVAAV
jgi:phosphohistidine phosphatase SixA